MIVIIQQISLNNVIKAAHVLWAYKFLKKSIAIKITPSILKWVSAARTTKACTLQLLLLNYRLLGVCLKITKKTI